MTKEEKCECGSNSAKIINNIVSYQTTIRTLMLYIVDINPDGWNEVYQNPTGFLLDASIQEKITPHRIQTKGFNSFEESIQKLKQSCNIETEEIIAQFESQRTVINKLNTKTDTTEIAESLSDLMELSEKFKDEIINALNECSPRQKQEKARRKLREKLYESRLQ